MKPRKEVMGGWGYSRLESLLQRHGTHMPGNHGSTDIMESVAGHNLNDHNGLPDGTGVVVSVTAPPWLLT